MAVEREGSELQRTISECPVCYLVYDNASKTPLLLPCGHTFCMECLARICTFLKQDETFPCPLCRTAVSIPPGGVPNLSPDLELMSAFPPGLQAAQKVWLEGSRLCWLETNEDDDIGTVVTLQLLSHPGPELSNTSHLVGVHHTPRVSRYWIFSSNCCCLSLLITGGLVMVFGIVFFPVYLIKGP